MSNDQPDLFDQLKGNTAEPPDAITVDKLKHWADICVTEIKNTEESWQQDGRKIIEAANQAVFERHCLAVLINFGEKSTAELEEERSEDPAPEEETAKQKAGPTDVTLNLQYFFPYCDQALRDRPDLRIVLVVICPDESDQRRVMRYLSAMSSVKPRLCIATAVSKSKASIRNARLDPVGYNARYISALLPLFCVGEKKDITPSHGEDDKADDLSVKKLSGYTDAFYEYMTQKKKSKAVHEKLCPQHHMLLEAGYAAIEGIEGIFYGSIPKGRKNLKKDIQIIKNKIKAPDTSPEDAEKAKKELAKKEKALSENSAEMERRKGRIAEFWKVVYNDPQGKNRLSSLPLLTQVIWLCCLYHLLYQGEVLDRETQTPRHSQIDLILWDSVAYSEGILQLLENCCLHSQHFCGYVSIYFHRIGLNRISEIGRSAERRMRLYYRYRTNRFDSFEDLSESVYIEFNVTDMGRDKDYHAQGIEVRSQRNLLDLFEGKGSSEDAENAAHHYGMPLFYRTVLLKRGRFICTTPCGEGEAVRLVGRRLAIQKDKDKYTVLDSAQAWTGYQVLLPLAPRPRDESAPAQCGDELLDSSYLRQKCMPSRYDCRVIEKEDVLPEGMDIGSASQKIELAARIRDRLGELISPSSVQPSVYALKMMQLSSLELELYLKGLFLFIAKNQEKGLLFRLLFTDEYALSEAVRRFSIFYDRNGENGWMAHTQVAFCSAESQHFPIRLILAGRSIQTARATAKQYMQFNIDISSGFLLSQIEYLTSFQSEGKKGPIAPEPLFPFDLVPFDSRVSTELDLKRRDLAYSDFGRKIATILETDLQEKACGCKIRNAHVRLGSKIHIQDFYDAELLFQSVANIYRFAYLLVEQIILCVQNKWKDPRPLYLIGYENYASILVEEAVRLLGRAWPEREEKIRHFQYVKTSDDKEKIVDMDTDCKEKDSSKEKIVDTDCKEEDLSKDAIMVTILPIGTTLSTIYKIKNAFFRKYKIEIPSERQYNFSLIVVGPSPESGPASGALERDDRAFPDMFWKKGKGRTVELTSEIVPGPGASEEKTIVHWFFMVQTRWMMPDRCFLCGDQEPADGSLFLTEPIPITQVDKTSTIPKLIFPLKGSDTNHGISFSLPRDPSENMERLEKMKSCFTYGHIQRGTNHYQFYIKYQKYYREVRSDCIQWFRKVQAEIDQNAFNIIVSPLQYDNCPFVKDAVDHLFLHSLRFIYISLRQAYREEIRSRFSYIAKEYQDACAGAVLPRYNIYYIDYSIVSGGSLHRSRALIQMLLNDAGPSTQIDFFEKVILLTNRSSFDTAATFVRDPKTDFLAFSTLCIPSYNTLSNRCPACEMVETYQTIAKCSATNELFWHYHDLEQKHRLKTVEENYQDLRELHFSKANYLSCFCQSLVCHLDWDFMGKMEYDRVKAAFEDALARCGGPSKPANGSTLGRIKEAAADRKAIQAYYDALIDGRNWRRLICTHEAVLLTERMGIQLDGCGPSWEDVNIRVEMWRAIVDRLSTVKGETAQDMAAKRFERREWLISYIKAFSREYPAKVAPIRRAAYTLLEILFWELISQTHLSDDVWRRTLGENWDKQNVAAVTDLLRISIKFNDDRTKQDVRSAEILQLYQLYLILGKRLCDLQSNLLLKYDVLKEMERFLASLKREQTALSNGSSLYSALLELPDDNGIQSDHLYMIKWAAMSSSEEAKAFLLQRSTDRMFKASGDTEEKPEGRGPEKESSEEGRRGEKNLLCSRDFAEVLRQENTRVLYSGIKRLDKMVDDKRYDWDFLMDEVKRAMLRSGWPEEAFEYSALTAGTETGEVKGGDPFAHILPQNPLYDLFKYLEADLKLDRGNAPSPAVCKELLAALLGFYRLMEALDDKPKREAEKDYINIYGQLCFILGKLGGYKNCCLIHRTNGENVILAQHLTDQVDDLTAEIQKILNYCHDARQLEEGTLYNTVAKYSAQDGRVSALVLALRIKQNSDVAYQQKVYAVLFSVEENMDEKQTLPDPRMARSHYLLFMRQRLQASLERDLYALHHFKFSRDDVVPIGSANGAGPLCILHLSDLHISKKNEDTVLKLIRSNQKELKEGDPELLVVTGDVVQGNGSAIDLEENYKCAGNVLRTIAEILWTGTSSVSGQKVLRGDWKKRIIIIPGNHDYSSMNELVASSTLRVTTLGIPTQRNGSPMSRYAYYIQFLQDLLDIDPRQSIRNNLNDVIEYPAAGLMLRFIALNSVAEVGPLRNNKVQLDGDYISTLPKQSEEDGFLNICLSHHTWCYTPDYFADRYSTKGLTEPAIHLAERMIALYKEGRDELSRKDANEADVITKINKKIDDLTNTLSAESDLLCKVMVDPEISQDVLYLKEHWAEMTNERCQHIIFDYELNRRMAETDLREYEKRIEKLIDKKAKGYPVFIMLGGHTHKAGWTVSINHGKVKPGDLIGKYACAEGPKFYCEEEGILQFGRLIITPDGKQRMVEYQFVPGTSVRTLNCAFESKDPNA